MMSEVKKDDNKLLVKNVRLAFPALFEPKQVNGEGTPAFSASFILPPDHPDIKKIEAEMARVAKAKWGDKADAILKSLKASDKTALHDGDTKADYEGYAGNLFISARNKTRPTVIGQDRAPLTQADGKPYAGCYVDAIIELWAQSNDYGKRINASLKGVQFRKDGDAFSGGGVADANDFDDLSDQGDEEDLAS